jgi:hypothetical protein
MSDYPYGAAAYDAGAVIDMNNLAIGYFPRGQWSGYPASIPQALVSPPQAPQAQPQPETPAAGSETSS